MNVSICYPIMMDHSRTHTHTHTHTHSNTHSTYMELAVSLRACCLMLSCCLACGLDALAMATLACVDRCVQEKHGHHTNTIQNCEQPSWSLRLLVACGLEALATAILACVDRQV